MDYERLIEEVRKHGELYDKQNKNYLDYKKKDKIWKDMSEKLGIDAKAKWTYLRDKYMKEKKKMDQPSGSAAPYSKQWILFPYMAFLDQYVRPRRLTENSLPENNFSSDSIQYFEDDLIVDESSILDSDVVEKTSSSSAPGPSRSTKRHYNNEIDDMFKHTLEKIGRKYDVQDDLADQHFLESIKFEMAKMSPTAKLNFKMIMLQKAKEALEENK